MDKEEFFISTIEDEINFIECNIENLSSKAIDSANDRAMEYLDQYHNHVDKHDDESGSMYDRFNEIRNRFLDLVCSEQFKEIVFEKRVEENQVKRSEVESAKKQEMALQLMQVPRQYPIGELRTLQELSPMMIRVNSIHFDHCSARVPISGDQSGNYQIKTQSGAE